MSQLAVDYNALFADNERAVSPYRSAWVRGAEGSNVRASLPARGIPLADTPADHIGMLLLTASWLGDQSAGDENEASETLFVDCLLPWCGTLLGKVEVHANMPFWRTIASLTRDAIDTMWNELQEDIDE